MTNTKRALAVLTALVFASASAGPGPGNLNVGGQGGHLNVPLSSGIAATYPLTSTECTGDALTGTHGETVTVSRSSSGTCQKSDGTLVLLSSDKPRVEADGLLVEASATNALLQSSDGSNASWTKSNATCTKDATGPDGAANSATTCTATAANATVLQSTSTASASRTSSIYVKRRTGTGNIDLTRNGGTNWTTLSSSNCAALDDGSALAPTSAEWVRCQVNSTVASPNVGLRIVTSGDAVDFFIGQDEAGALASSPIATTGATATRSTDLVTVGTLGWPYATGDVSLEFTPAATPTDGVFFDTRVTTSAGPGAMLYFVSGALRLLTMNGTTGTATTTTASSWTVGQTYRIRAKWGAGNTYVYVDDVLVGSNTSGSALMPTALIATATVGSNIASVAPLRGYIKNLSIGKGATAMRLFAAIGDSITIGSPYTSADPWPSKLKTSLGAGWSHRNYAVAGSVLSYMQATEWDAGAQKQRWTWVTVLGGVNDIKGGASAATVKAALQTLYEDIEANGNTVIPMTIMPYGNFATWTSDQQTVLEEVNAWILSWGAANGRAVVDLYTEMGDPSDPETLLADYDGGDGLHPSDAGAAHIAELVEAVISP